MDEKIENIQNCSMARKCSISVVVFFICLCAFSMVVGCLAENRTIHKDIYSLGDTMSVYGGFLLGSGNIESHPVYVFYEKTDRGSFVISWVDAYHAEIFMDENEQPYVILRESHVLGNKIRDRYGNLENDWSVVYAEFHVPENTVIQTYNLNSE